MARKHTTKDGDIPFTAEEEAEWDAREAKVAEEEAMKNWVASMVKSDSQLIPRYLEDLITDNSSLTLGDKLKEKYDAKIALRNSKPKG